MFPLLPKHCLIKAALPFAEKKTRVLSGHRECTHPGSDLCANRVQALTFCHVLSGPVLCSGLP